MKKVYIFLTAICLAAMTSCIKEEPFTLEEVNIEVNLDTRSASSSQQGDKIEDVMVWVFDTANNNFNLVGYRTYTPPTGTYTSLSLHIPVATCNGDASTYRVVAVLNKNSWGGVVNADGETLTLGPSTTYAELTSARFANAALINEVIAESNPGNPAVMPVSHWCDVSINKNNNTHTINENTQKYNCASADLSVYRSVAKTQLFMSKANDDFVLEVIGASIHSASAPSQGVLLSEDATKVDWFGNVAPAYSTPSVISLKNAEDTDKNAIFVGKTVGSVSSGTTYNGEFVASTFLYENPDGWTISDWTSHDCSNAPEGAGLRDDETSATEFGYYMEVKYKINDGAETTSYVPLPSVVRNHDYQVRALVEAGGKLSLSLAVNEWKEEKQELDYLNEVSIGSVTWNPVASSDKTITLGSGAGVSATCEFELPTPKNGKWRVELITTSGKEGAFEVASVGSSSYGQSAEGLISAENTKFTIRTTASNFNAPAVNAAKVRLIAETETNVGGTKRTRTYEVKNFDYTIVQSR